MKSNVALGALIACLSLQACSSRPRDFTPTLSAAPASPSALESAYATCRRLFVASKLDSSGKSLSGGAGAAAGVATAAVGGSAAAAVGGYAGLAAVGATIVLLPFAVVGGAIGMSKIKRAKNERAIKTAMEGCLRERGYQVADWVRSAKKPVIAGPGAK